MMFAASCFLLNYLVVLTIGRSLETTVVNSCQRYTEPVKTKYGNLKGLVSERARIFYGIPYALPPVGKRRWKAPEEALSVGNKTFLSIAQPPACPQVCRSPVGTCPAKEFSEDCLYLNIFTPLNVDEVANLPVMIYIHGGNFDNGGAATQLYDAQHLANTTNTILVVINYRVGALGFLVIDRVDESLNGNFAMLDQRLAFKYVQENIGAFGGDPNSVTLFGQSAGAQSIAIHMISPDSDNLFHRSIMQSNPFTLPYRDRVSAAEIGSRLAEVLRCNDVDCLRSRSADAVLEAQFVVATSIDYADLLQNIEYWGPVIDGTVVVIHPLKAYAGNTFQDKPMMMGSLSEDALPYVYDLLPFAVPSALARTILTALFGLVDGLRMTALYPLGFFGRDERDALTDIATDMIFACSARHASISVQLNGNSNVYMYEFAHAFSFEEAWGPAMSYCYGHVCHGGELPFLFQNAGELDYEYTPDELTLSESMIYYWANFAHTGDPNKVGEKSTLVLNSDFTEWPVFNVDSGMAQLRLGTPTNVPLTDYKTDKCDLFDSIGYDVTYELSIGLANEIQSYEEGNMMNETTIA